MARDLELALRVRADLNRATREIRGLRQDLTRTGEAARRAGRQTVDYGRNLETARRQAGNITRSLVGMAAAYVSIHSAVRLAGRAAGFETSLARITGLVGIARNEVAAMGRAVLALGPEVGRGPGELAEALFFVTSAGARGAQALDVLKQSARAAAAGLGDTATVADAVTSAINAYGAGARSAGDATGVLVAAVREGKADAASFAPVLGRVLSVAAELGVELHEVAAAIAFLTRQGLNADEAATSLRATLAAMLNPSRDGVRALEEAGLSAEELREVLAERGLIDALDLLKDAFGDNEQALTRVFPNIRALTGVLSIVGANADTARAVFRALARAGIDVLDEAFGAVAETAEFRFAVALADIEAQAIRLGSQALPAAASALKALADNFDLVIAAVAAFAGFKLTVLLAGAASATLKLATVMRGAAGAVAALNVAMRANPVLLVASGVAALAGGLTLLSQRSREAAEAQGALTDELIATADAAAVEDGLERLRKQRYALRAMLDDPGFAQHRPGWFRQILNELFLAKPAGETIEGLQEGIAAVDREIADLEARLEQLRAAETSRPGSSGANRPGGGLAQRTAEMREIERIQSAANDRIAELTLGRIALIEREEHRLLDRLAALKDQEGVDEQARQAAIASVEATALHAKERALQEQLDREDDLRRRHGHEIAQQDAAARDDIRDRFLATLPPLEEALARARQWRQETLAALDETAEGYEEHAARVETVFADMVATAEKTAAATRRTVVAGIEAASLALASPYARARAEIEKWKTDTIAALEQSGDGWEEYAARAEAIATERLARAAEEEAERRLRASKRWQDGAVRGLGDYAKEAGDAAARAEDAMVGAFRGMEDALVEFTRTGKLSFSGLVDSILADIARMTIRQSITGPLAGALGDILKSIFSPGLPGPYGGAAPGTAPLIPVYSAPLPPLRQVGHGGGIAGALGGVRRAVPPEVFAHAPRYHRGGIAGMLRPDEVPIIAQTGERILSRAETQALGQPPAIEINFENTGTPKREVDREVRFDGARAVVTIFLADLENHGAISQGLEGAYGIRRAGI